VTRSLAQRAPGRELVRDPLQASLDGLDRVGAENQPQWWFVRVEDGKDRVRGLGRVAWLQAVVALDVCAGGPDGVGILGHRLGFVRGSGTEQPGTEGARLDDKRHDAEPGDLVAQRLGHALEGEFGRAVGSEAGGGGLAPDARHLHDRAATLAAHVREHQAGQRRRGEEVQLKERPQLLVGCLFHRADLGAAGIVDEHVNATESLKRLGHRSLALVRGGYVERQRVRAIWQPAERLGAAGTSGDRVTARQGGLRDGPAEPARGARNKPNSGVTVGHAR